MGVTIQGGFAVGYGGQGRLRFLSKAGFAAAWRTVGRGEESRAGGSPRSAAFPFFFT